MYVHVDLYTYILQFKHTLSAMVGKFHNVQNMRWLNSCRTAGPEVTLLSMMSRELMLLLYGLGYFLNAASAILSHGWLWRM